MAIAGPDAVTRYDNPESTYPGLGWVEESAKQIGDGIGIFEIHDYTAHDLVKSGEFKVFHKQEADIAKGEGKQIIFGELGMNRSGQKNQDRASADPFACEDSQMEVYDHSYGVYMADAVIQGMNAGFSGAAAWALDDAIHTCGDLGNKNELKRWGMWNSLGTEICNNPSDENIRPWFYSWSLMCRYFPSGSTIVKTDTTGIQGLRLTAGVFNNELTVAIVNNSDIDNVLSLALPTAKPMRKFIYVEGESKVDENGFPVAVEKDIKSGKINGVGLPANSFVLFTTFDF